MSVAFFDATRSALAHEADLTAAFLRVVRSGRYILGEEVEAFERDMAEFVGVQHAIGVSSGTDALLVTLMALGIGRGDEVIVPAYGFVATPEAVARLGAKPVFVDVLETTLNIDPEQAARRVGPRTKAIIAVHLFGTAADMESLAELDVPIVEDAAQALGTRIRDRRVGAIGRAGCFSFFPTKNLGGFGDAGLVTTSDERLAKHIRLLRNHGSIEKHAYMVTGGNFRLDPIHAALLGVELGHLEGKLARRVALAERYRAQIAKRGIDDHVAPLASLPGSTFNQFIVRVRNPFGARDRVRSLLADRGIQTEVYYPMTLAQQPCFPDAVTGRFPIAEFASWETLALPIYPELTDAEVDEVVHCLAQVLA